MIITTYTRKQIDIENLQLSDIDIIDIAKSLSNQCRFNGHLENFYSVAQHSVECSLMTRSPRVQFLCLLHDSAEYLHGDVIRPIKEKNPNFEIFEKINLAKILDKFGVGNYTPDEWSQVIKIDNLLLEIEIEYLLKRREQIIQCFDPYRAWVEFTNRFKYLYKKVSSGQPEKIEKSEEAA